MSDIFSQTGLGRYDVKKNPGINEELRRQDFVLMEDTPGLELPRHVYELGQRLIAESPDDPDTTVARLNSAYFLSRQLGRPLEDVYADFDTATEEYWGKATPPQSAWEAVSNSYKGAYIGTQIADLGYKLFLNRGDGDDLYKRIQELEAQMPPEDTLKRSLPITALKWAAQFLPSQIESFKAGAVQGAATSVAATVIAGPAVAPVALTGVGSLTLPAISALAYGVGAAHGSAERARQIETGALYYDLLRYQDPVSGARINPKAAWGFAAAYGGFAAVVEMIEADEFFKAFPGMKDAVKRAALAAADDPAAKAARSGFAQRAMRQYVEVAKDVAKGRAGKVAGETLQETAQEGLSIAAEEFAKQVTARIDGVSITPATAQEITKRITETMVGSALGMGALNALPTAANLFFPAVKSAADVAKNAAMQGQEERTTGGPLTQEELELFKRRMNEPLPENYQVQASEVADGEVYTLKMGTKDADPETGKAKRFGWVRYEVDRDAMAVKILGYEKGAAPNVNSALTQALMLRFPGWEIQADMKNPHLAALHQVLREQNPRGSEAGLQWYKTPAPRDAEITYSYIKDRIQEAKPGWSPEDVEFSVRFLDTWGRAMGTTGEKLADGIFTAEIIGERGAAVAAQGAFGSTALQMVDKQMRAVIQLTRNANPSTWMHEATHAAVFFALQNRQDAAVAKFLGEIEGYLGVENGDWDAPVKGWTENYRGDNQSALEALAYAVEDYFLTGKVPDPKMKSLFHRIAKWLTDLYRSLKGARYQISPELERYFDRLFADPESPLYELATTKGEEEARPAPKTAAKQNPGGAVAPDAASEGQDTPDAAKAPPEAPTEEMEIYQGYGEAQDLEAAGKPTDETGWSRSPYDREWRYRSEEQRRADIDRPVQATARALDTPPAGDAEVSGYIKELYQSDPERESGEVWVYRSEEVLASKMQGPMPGKNVLAMLKGAGVKADELKWTGLDDFLNTDEKKTPQEVRDFIAANKLQIQEITKGSYIDEEAKRWGHTDPVDHEDTKYERYTIPGGENYREVLFTFTPKKTESLTEKQRKALIDEKKALDDAYFSGPPAERERIAARVEEINGILEDWEREADIPAYESSHWSEDNVLAHTRLNDRTDAQGRRMLFVEEIQSDWHQEGRKRGYDVKSTPGDKARLVELYALEAEEHRNRRDGHQYWEEIHALEQKTGKGVPSAPFQKTWHEFVFKRILREGAENGYDVVGWTTGEQQAERYDLSKQIKWIEYHPKTDEVYVYDNANRAIDEIPETITQDKLADYFGKEVAEKLVAKSPDDDGAVRLDGLDLKVGGEGMKGFYDKMLVDFANKYGKKWGAQVEESSLDGGKWAVVDAGTGISDGQIQRGGFESKDAAEQWAEDEGLSYYEVKQVPTAIHAIPVTDAMRESVLKGQVLFQRAVESVLSLDELTAAAEKAGDWKDWYDRHVSQVNEHFGKDADLFLKLLSATSQATSVPGNVTLAVKAYNQLVSGQDFEGFLPAVIKNLERIRNEEAIQGQKIAEFGKATSGDEDGIAVDRHIAELLFNTTKPTAAMVSEGKRIIRAIAMRLGWNPRGVQASLWAYNQIRKGMTPASYDAYIKKRQEEIRAIQQNAGRQLFQGQGERVENAVMDIAEDLEAEGIPYNIRSSRDTNSKYIEATIDGQPYWIRASDHPQGPRSRNRKAATFDAVVGRNWRPAFRQWLGGVLGKELNTYEEKPRDARTVERGRLTPELFQIDDLNHGAKAGFVAFDHNYMGTGEGQQVYGWGSYLTENRGVARSHYAERLGSEFMIEFTNENGSVVTIGGKTRDPGYRKIVDQFKKEFTKLGPGVSLDDSKAILETLDRAISTALEDAAYDDDVTGGRSAVNVENAANWMKEHIDREKPLRIQYGRWLYTTSVETKGKRKGMVMIPAGDGWDAPIREGDIKKLLKFTQKWPTWDKKAFEDFLGDDYAVAYENWEQEGMTNPGENMRGFVEQLEDELFLEEYADMHNRPWTGKALADYLGTDMLWGDVRDGIELLKLAGITDIYPAEEGSGTILLDGESLQRGEADLFSHVGDGAMDPRELVNFANAFYDDDREVPNEQAFNVALAQAAVYVMKASVPGIEPKEIEAWANAAGGMFDYDLAPDNMKAHIDAVTTAAIFGLNKIINRKHKASDSVIRAAEIIQDYWGGPDEEPHLFLVANEKTPKPDPETDGRWLRWDKPLVKGDLEDVQALVDQMKEAASEYEIIADKLFEIFGEATANELIQEDPDLMSLMIELSNDLSMVETWEDTTGDKPTGGDLYDVIYGSFGGDQKKKYSGLHSKLTSLLLHSAGIDGVTYPVAFLTGGTGDKGMNYVVFDDQAIKITRRVLFQGEGENAEADAAKAHQFSGLDDPSLAAIKDEARTFDTWEEFAEFVETFFEEELQRFTGADKLDETEKLRFYREMWEAANRPADSGADLPTWAKALEANDYRGLTEFLEAIWDEILSGEMYNFQPLDLEEADRVNSRRARADRIKGEIAEVVKAGAIRIGAKEKAPTPKFLASVMGDISKNPEPYARIYGELFEVPELVESAKTAEAEKYADIDDPKFKESRLTISQKAAIAEILRNEEVGRKILRGDLVVGDEVKRYITSLKAESREQAKKIGELQAEIRDDNRILSESERRWVKASARISQADEELKKIDARITKLSQSNKRIPKALLEEQINLKRIRETMEAQRDKARRKVGNPARLQTTLAKIEEAARMKIAAKDREVRRKAAQRLKAYEAQLVKQIMHPPSDRINAQQAMAIADIQAMIDPHRRSEKTQATIEALRAEIEKNPAITREIGREWLNRAAKKNLSEFTLAELEELASKVKALRTEGRAIFKTKEEARQQYAMSTQERIADLLLHLPGAANPGEKPDPDTLLGKLAGKIRDFDYAFTKSPEFARMMDGHEGGPNYELLITERDRAYRKEMEQVERRVKLIMDAFKREGVDPEDWYKQEVSLVGAGPGRSTRVMRKSDVLALELAFRNEDSRQAAIFGNFFSHYEKRHMSEEDLYFEAAERFNVVRAAMDSVITEQDLRILETFAGDGDETGRRLFETVAEVENRIMEMVDNYFPINREGVTGDPIDVQIAGDVLNRTPGTKRPPKNGFTKSRINISPKHQTPIKLDLLSTWMKSIQAQEHYIANAAYGKKLNDVYLNNFMQEQIRAAMGDQGVTYLKEYIAEVKNPGSLRNMARWENSVKWLRGNLGAAYLGFRTSSVLKQFITSPWPAMAYAGPTRFTAETFKCLANPVKYVSDAEALSTVLRNRTADLVMEAVKTANATSQAGRNVQKAMQIGVKGLEIADRVSVAIGWRALYEKEMAAHGDMTKAIEVADDMVLKTQPSARGVDLAPVYRTGGEAMKMLLQFTAPMNVIWNNIRHDLPAAIKDKHYARAVGIMTSYIIAGVLLSLATEGDDEDEEKRGALLAFYAFTQGTESIPLIGADVTRLVRTAITGDGGYDFPDTALPGASQVFDGLTTMVKDPDNWGRGLEQFASGVGLTVGAPVSGFKELRRVAGGDLGALTGKPRKKKE